MIGFTTAVLPAVSSVFPADGAADVAANASVVVTFSKAMDPAGISTSTIALSSGSAAVAGTVDLSADRKTATFTRRQSRGAWMDPAIECTTSSRNFLSCTFVEHGICPLPEMMLQKAP